MTRPLRRITLHLSQIFFTLGLTFMSCPPSGGTSKIIYCTVIRKLLVTINNPTSSEVVGTEFYDDTVSWKNANIVLTHLPANVRENSVPIR